MPDADQFKIQNTLGAVATLFEQGEADVLTDGHTFSVRRAGEVVPFLDGLLDQAGELQAAAALVDIGKPVRPHDFAAHFAETAAELTSGGANPNPIFTGMMAVNQLGELGLRPDGEQEDAAWSRPALVDPEPVSGMPRGRAVLPAAAAMLRWKLHGNDR